MVNERYKYLDFVRGIAVLLVMYDHLVGTGTWSIQIPDIINEVNNVNLPIIPGDTHKLWYLSSLLYNSAATQCAVTGVFLFFILTGYLVPDSLERYTSSAKFLVNRFFRIFPTLWICLIIVCVTVYTFQGISFSSARIFASMLMLYKILKITSISGVLWTLSIELFFYLLCAIVKRFSISKVYVILFITFILIYACPAENYYIYSIMTNLKWVSIILCGITFNLVKKDQLKGNFLSALHLLFVPVISFVCFNIYANKFGDDSTYFHLGTYMFALLIFFTANYISTSVPQIFESVIFKPLYKIAELCFPIYLIHLPVGLCTMYQIKRIGGGGIENSLVPLLGAGISILIAQIISWIAEKPSIRISKIVCRYLK